MRISSSKPRHSAGHQSRQGIALVAAIVAFALAATMLFHLLKSTLEQQRQILMHRQELQADWLATAGIDRAVARLKQSSDYVGETWRISADELNKQDSAEVVIRVDPTEEPNQHQITVQADYPADTIHRNRKTRRYRWTE